MTTDRFRRRLDQIERSHPAGGWRRWSSAPIEDWPDHALEDLTLERLPGKIGAAVPPALGRAALKDLKFLMLLISGDTGAARQFLRQLAQAEI
jgi:hypothetical protein